MQLVFPPTQTLGGHVPLFPPGLTPLPARESGERCKLPQRGSGLGAEPRSQTHFWRILRLGNASGRNNFNDFPDSQLTKFRALHTGMQLARTKWQYDFKPTKEMPVYHTGA